MSPTVGGQAVPGGVALRQGRRMAAAVRAPSGEIVTRSWDLPEPGRIARLPGVRGLVAIAGAIRSGVGVMGWAGRQSRTAVSTRRGAARIWPVVGVLATAATVFAVPVAATSLLPDVGPVAATARDGWLQVVVFVGVLAGLARLAPVRRLLANHGAEHKVVRAHELGLPLTIDAARPLPRFHARCGTSFAALLVLAMGAASPAAVGLGLDGLVAELAVTVVVAAGVYELQRFAATLPDHRVAAKVVLAPGLWLQRLTTVDPDDDQLEVALVALRLATGEAPLRAGIPAY